MSIAFFFYLTCLLFSNIAHCASDKFPLRPKRGRPSSSHQKPKTSADICTKLLTQYTDTYLYRPDDATQRRSEALSNLQKEFPNCMTQDKSQALTLINWAIKLTKDSIGTQCDGGPHSDVLTLLKLLPGPDLEDSISSHELLKEPLRSRVLERLCTHPDDAQAFQGTSLDLDLWIQKLMAPTDSPSSSAGSSGSNEHAANFSSDLQCFIRYGRPDFIKKYESSIMIFLPALIIEAPESYHSLIILMKQKELPLLQRSAQAALITASATKHNPFWKKSMIQGLLALDEYSNEERSILYQQMNTVYQETRDIEGLQYLWMHLQNNASQQALLQQSVAQYFGIQGQSSNQASLPFPVYLNCAIATSYNSGTLTQDLFFEVLQTAHRTGLASIIYQRYFTAVYDTFVFDEQTEFRKRAISLDQRLIYYSRDDSFFARLDDIQDPDFKHYIENIRALYDPFAKSFEICAAKKALKLLHKKYGLKNKLPEIVRRHRGELPNFSVNRHDTPTDAILLDRDITAIHIKPNELVYATDNQCLGHTLSAIDPQSGDAVWQYPLESRFESRYANHITVFDQNLYVIDDSCIVSLDKNTGRIITRYPIPVACDYNNLMFFAPDSNGNIYISCLPNLSAFLNTQTGQFSMLNDDFRMKSFIAQNTLGYFDTTDGTLTLRTEDLSITKIPCLLDLKRRWFFNPKVATKDGRIVFERLMQDNTSQLVSYDINTHTELWSMPHPGELANKPCISEDGNMIVIICDQDRSYSKCTVIAFENAGDSCKQIWHLPAFHNVDQLALSPDGKKLFALENLYGKLYTLNAETGELLSVDTYAKGSYLLGTSPDGKPIIQY